MTCRISWSNAKLIAAVAAVLMTAAPAPAEGWWNAAWPYRRPVTIPRNQPTNLPGDDVAEVAILTAGQHRPDGGDIRVATAGGHEMPLRVLQVGPGDEVRLAFAVRPGVTDYHVYFGCENPPTPPRLLEIRRGVLMETWQYPGGATDSPAAARKVLDTAETLLGRDLREQIFLGHNPFGPQDAVASRFTAWLICPSAGRYTFAASSQNASFLLINDQLLIDNGGFHKPQRDIRKQATVQLPAGPAKLEMLHVSPDGHPIVVAAWKPPGDARVQPIPATAFAPVLAGRAGTLERYSRSETADISARWGGEAFVAGRYLQRYSLQADLAGGNADRARWSWDFGDGQTSEDRSAEHVYLRPGPYTVRLTARTGRTEQTVRQRIFVSRPWDAVHRDEMDDVAKHARIVAGYDVAKLSAGDRVEAALLLDAAGEQEALGRVGEALLAGKLPPPATDLRRAVEACVDAMVTAGRAERAVSLLRSAGEEASHPLVAAELAVLAGRVAMDELADPNLAERQFGWALRLRARLAGRPVLRSAQIGLGDVYRLRGNRERAREAYRAAGLARGRSLQLAPVRRGDLARHVESYLRDGKLDAAEEYLDRWADELPADKLDGYWSLLAVRLHVRRDRPERALREIETLLRVHPRSNYAPQLLTIGADTHQAAGRSDAARALLQRLADDYPESPLAAEAAGRLAR